MEHFDVAIIGMGPAGSTLARLLAGKRKVVVIDQKALCGGEGFRKPCGGLLSPDAQKALSRFGLTLPKEILVTPQIFAVKTVDVKSGLVRNYQRFYLNMDRRRFDLWLASLVGPGVVARDRARCSRILKTEGGFLIEYVQDGVARRVTARFLVGADGANSMVRRQFLPAKIREYLSIQQWFHEENPKPFYASIFDEEITDCYAWGSSKDGIFCFGAALPKRESRKRFERLKEKLRDFGFRFGEPVRTEACLVLRPQNPFALPAAKNGVFLIGEAAGFISPSSLEGISYAMNSALALAKALLTDQKDPEARYRRSVLPIRLKIASKLLKNPFLYWPFLRRLVMRSKILSIRELP